MDRSKLPGTLSFPQIDHFRRMGFLLLPRAVPAEAIEECRSGLAARRVACGGEADRVDDIFQAVPAMRAVASGDALLGPLKSLLGNNIEFCLNRHNHATFLKGTNRSVRLHRDVLQWSRPIVTAIVYLSDSGSEQGATRVIPGSHFLPFVGKPNNGGTWMDEHHVFSDLIGQAVPVPATTGDVLLLDGLLFHASGTNTTPDERWVATFAYRSVDELDDSLGSSVTELVCGTPLFRGRAPSEQPIAR